MQSFKYSVPSQPEKRPGPPRLPRAVLAAAAAVLLGGLWLSPVPGHVAASLSWLAGSPAEAEEKQAQVAQRLREADAHLGRGAFMAARTAFEEALSLQPDSVVAYRRARDTRYLEGAEAGPDLEALLPDPADRARFFLALGEAEREKGRLAPAIEAFQLAIALAPSDPAAYLGQGRALEAAGRKKEAIASYAAARERAPQDLAVAAAHLQARYRHDSPDGAVAEAEALFKPLARQGADEAAHVGLLEAYIRQGLGPDEIRARYMVEAAHLPEHQRQLFVAKAYMRHFLANPNWHQASYDRALAAAGAARKAPATRAAAAQLIAEAHAERSLRYFERSDFEAAQAEIAKAVALKAHLPHPRQLADLYVRRGHAQASTGHAAGLTQNLEYALSVDPGHPCRRELAQAYANVGVGFLSIRKAHEAVKPLTRALALTPEDAALYARLHQALARARRPQPLAACGKAAGLEGEGPRHLQLVRGLVALELPKEAARAAAAASRAKLPAPYPGLIEAELSVAEGQLTAARVALAKSVERHAGDAEAWRRLGEIDRALAEKDPDRRAMHLAHARESHRHALALGDAGSRAVLIGLHRDLAEDAIKRRAFDEAARLAEQGRLLDDHDPWLALAQGTALVEQGKHEPAARALQAGLIGLDGAGHPAHAALRERRGQALKALERYDEAIAEFRAGLAHEAKASPARCATLYYELAFALAANREREEATSAIRQYVFWSLHDPEQADRVTRIQALEATLGPKS